MNNFMEVKFDAISENEGFARVCVAAFCVPLNPSVDVVSDIKTAVSEAVTNCVVHAYPRRKGMIKMSCQIKDRDLIVKVSDEGIGIKDIAKAREPFFTSKPDGDRSGMGFAVMESFMDRVEVEHNEAKGITVTMYKRIENIKEAMAE